MLFRQLSAVFALGVAQASPLILSDLPNESSAIIHVDAERMSKSQVGAAVMALARAGLEGSSLSTIEAAGFDFANDVKGVTIAIFPRSVSGEEFAVYLRGNYDSAKLRSYAKKKGASTVEDPARFKLNGVLNNAGQISTSSARCASAESNSLLVLASSSAALEMARQSIANPRSTEADEKSIAARESLISVAIFEKMIAESAGPTVPPGVLTIGMTLDETNTRVRCRFTAACVDEKNAVDLGKFLKTGASHFADRFIVPRKNETSASKAARRLIVDALSEAKIEVNGRLVFLNIESNSEKLLDCLSRIETSADRHVEGQ